MRKKGSAGEEDEAARVSGSRSPRVGGGSCPLVQLDGIGLAPRLSARLLKPAALPRGASEGQPLLYLHRYGSQERGRVAVHLPSWSTASQCDSDDPTRR